jgi:hypothetical protein
MDCARAVKRRVGPDFDLVIVAAIRDSSTHWSQPFQTRIRSTNSNVNALMELGILSAAIIPRAKEFPARCCEYALLVGL